MRLISNKELSAVSGGMAIAIAGPAIAAAISGTTDWSGMWGMDFSWGINESSSGGAEASGSGGGTVPVNSSKLSDAMALMQEIKSTASADVEISCKLHADSSGLWSVDCSFTFRGGVGGKRK